MRLREIKPGMAILCENKEQGDAVKEQLLKQGASWNGYHSASYSHNDRICYLNSEGKYDFYCAYILTIKFSDLIIPELTPAEVLKICNEICSAHENGNCSDCKMYNNCFFEMKSDFQKVVEICEQWKAEQEKKEPEKKKPEVEWVDICRIIEVQDNGFKKCVHEVDIKDADLPFGYKECTTEMILKEYMKSHSGNCFAVVEHVCRAKRQA